MREGADETSWTLGSTRRSLAESIIATSLGTLRSQAGCRTSSPRRRSGFTSPHRIRDHDRFGRRTVLTRGRLRPRRPPQPQDPDTRRSRPPAPNHRRTRNAAGYRSEHPTARPAPRPDGRDARSRRATSCRARPGTSPARSSLLNTSAQYGRTRAWTSARLSAAGSAPDPRPAYRGSAANSAICASLEGGGTSWSERRHRRYCSSPASARTSPLRRPASAP